MKKTIIIFSLALFGAAIGFLSCSKPHKIYGAVPVLPGTPFSYEKTTIHSPSTNHLTNAGATLGRVLFYDKLLSKNNNTACASCHNQVNGFADNGAFSLGFNGGSTRRNSLSIVDESHRFEYFWDSRVSILEEMVMKPIQHKVEMGFEEVNSLPAKLKLAGYYADLFTAAFGSPEITADKISKALAQFIRSIQSDNSKFDLGRANHFADFTSEEMLGLNLFTSKFTCNNCHTLSLTPINPADSISATGYNANLVNANIGLDEVYTDNGVGEISQFTGDNGKFRIPNLKNIGFTAPYMHDGRFSTLEQVIEHYNSGIKSNPNLNQFLQSQTTWGQPVRFNMTQSEKDALKSFLLTLDDEELASDEKFSNPFKVQ